MLYGADIEVSEVGSGFPTPPSLLASKSNDEDQKIKNEEDAKTLKNEVIKNNENIESDGSQFSYSTHPWNLLNLPKVDGSLLQSFPRSVPGVTCPWLYIGMLFSSFCWHTEDNYFAAVNYQHLGDEKVIMFYFCYYFCWCFCYHFCYYFCYHFDVQVWYVIPPSQAHLMEKLMREYLGHKKPEEVLHSLTIQVRVDCCNSY